jgi:hypothetical protein
MGNYVPCRTGEDGETHLYAAGDAARSLCGKSVDSPNHNPGGRGICGECGKRLLSRVFQEAGPAGLSSFDVTAR